MSTSRYRIRVKGILDGRWKSRFEELSLSYEGDDVTVLEGPVRDQASLHGQLERIRDLNLVLLSVAEEPAAIHTGSPQDVFRSAAHAEEFLRLYDVMLSRWPVEAEPVDVGTSFGRTRVNAAGSMDAPPLVLVPGVGANSTMFFANIRTLSADHRVYAVDTMGQPGRSVPHRSVEAGNVHTWLREVLDGLGIGSACLAGVSLGGWIALDFAIRHPDRVERVAVVDSAASFAPMSLMLLLHSFIPVMIHPTRSGLTRYFHWMTGGGSIDPQWVELMILGILNTRIQPHLRATPFSARRLACCQAPILLLIGENSVIGTPYGMVARAARLKPGIRAEIVPGASHALLIEQPDIANARLRCFFEEAGHDSRDGAVLREPPA